MLLDIFTKIENFNNRLLKKRGAIYLKIEGVKNSVKITPNEVVYAKTAALEHLGLLQQPYANFYFYYENNEYVFVIWHGKDLRRPWQVLYFLDENSKPGDLYSLVLDAEYLSAKSYDFDLSFIPNGFKMEVYSIFDYEIYAEKDNVIDINFKNKVA